MKTRNLFGVTKASLLLLALVFVFAITSCGDDGGDNPKTALEGTWESGYGSESLIISGNNFTYLDDYFSVKGTFTLNEKDGTITMNYTQYSYDGSKWYTYDQLVDEMIKEYMGESNWNRLSNNEKKQLRDQYREYIGYFPTSDSGYYYIDGETLYLGCENVSGAYNRISGGGKKPGSDPAAWSPSNYTTLSAGQWSSGNISSSGTREQWFRFTATASTQYIHVSFNSLTDLNVQVYNSSGSTIGEGSSNLYGSYRYTSRSLTSGQTYYIKVTPYDYDDYGSYQIAFNSSSTAPGSGGGTSVPGTPTNVTASAQSSSSIQISWNAPTTGGTPTYYIIYRSSSSGGTYSDVDYVSGSSRSYTDTGLYASTTYYYKVAAYNSAGTGPQSSYAYATTSSGGGSFPPSNYTTLSAGQWSSGNISSSGSREQWFRFTATASTQYIHVSFNSLTDLWVQIYNSSGNTVGDSYNLYGSYRYTSRSLTSGQTYYIKVTPYDSYDYGSYQIAFNTSSTAPGGGGGGTSVPGTPTNVTASAQSSSSIRITWSAPSSGGTPSYYNIYRSSSSSGTYSYIDYVYSTSYTDTGLYASTTYYYRVSAENSAGNGSQSSYASATTSSGGGSFPPYNYTTLSAGQWSSGNISSSGTREQWFRFTATASTQYIHVSFNSLTDLNVQVYNSSGSTVGDIYNLYGSYRYTSRSLTSGQTYYIRVWPYYDNEYGTYQIAFNTSSYAPN